jgi:hypothetical protein
VRGGGANGYIGLVITPAAYDIIAQGTPLNRQPAPPIQPTMPNAAPTQAQIAQAISEHAEAKREFNKYINIEKVIKK